VHLPGPIYLGPTGRRIEITSVEYSCEMPSMNVESLMMCPCVMRKAGHHSMLRRQPSRFMHNWGLDGASSHIVHRQLDEEIPRDNDAGQEFETQDQEVPVVKIPEQYAYLFRIKTEIAAMARPSDQYTKVIRENLWL
jgi:hypothetical protein